MLNTIRDAVQNLLAGAGKKQRTVKPKYEVVGMIQTSHYYGIHDRKIKGDIKKYGIENVRKSNPDLKFTEKVVMVKRVRKIDYSKYQVA
jgi:hypothetical protein